MISLKPAAYIYGNLGFGYHGCNESAIQFMEILNIRFYLMESFFSSEQLFKAFIYHIDRSQLQSGRS
jgi:hypothetical protein